MERERERERGHRRLRALVIIGAVVLLGAAVGVWVPTSSRREAAPGPGAQRPVSAVPPVGRPAPDFTLPLFSGGTLSLHSLRGRPVLLNFWASWCVPCRSETSLLVRLHKTYGPRGIAFVGADVQDEEQAARAFLGQYHVDYAVVRAGERMMTAYQIEGIPTTVFIRADGVVADKYTGAFLGPAGEKALKMRLDRLLEMAQPAVQQPR